jgi:hypothetical protein
MNSSHEQSLLKHFDLVDMYNWFDRLASGCVDGTLVDMLVAAVAADIVGIVAAPPFAEQQLAVGVAADEAQLDVVGLVRSLIVTYWQRMVLDSVLVMEAALNYNHSREKVTLALVLMMSRNLTLNELSLCYYLSFGMLMMTLTVPDMAADEALLICPF